METEVDKPIQINITNQLEPDSNIGVSSNSEWLITYGDDYPIRSLTIDSSQNQSSQKISVVTLDGTVVASSTLDYARNSSFWNTS